MPVLFWVAGRHRPVSTSDLWAGFLKYLPVWGIVTAVVWLVRRPIPDNQPFKEFLFAVPSGFLAGAAFIFVYPPARRVVMNLFSTLRACLKSEIFD